MTHLESTPARSRGVRQDEGWLLLRDPGNPYADGAEEDIFEILRAAPDVSNRADDLVADARTWPERYHLDPARSNVLRPFSIPKTAKILEIGAGCGAVTRYLGELGATVDALEPVPSRARAARERCRDLPNVEVLLGELDDVPAEPIYDFVVVVGVLEYVGRGTADLDVYRAFLRGISDRLAGSGTLILAIENKVGVKYLVGAPEDHSDRVFDSIEGYPVGGPARTFSRHELMSLFSDAGLTPKSFGAFPDYKKARVVMSLEDFPDEALPLVHQIPHFPSPDWTTPRPRLADERRVWRTLVEAGLAAETPNSFVMLGGKGGASRAWSPGLVAAYFSVGRRAGSSTAVRVLSAAGRITFERTPLYKVPAADISVRGSRESWKPGRDMVTYCEESSDHQIATALKQWSTLLDSACAGSREIPLDFVPHNLVVGPDGAVSAFDQEWFASAGTRLAVQSVRARGLIWLAARVAPRTHPSRWDDCTTVADLAIRFGRILGLDEDGSWLEQALEDEAWFQARVDRKPTRLTDEEWHRQTLTDLRRVVATPLALGPLGERDFEALTRLEGNVAKLERRLPGVTALAETDHLAALATMRVGSRVVRCVAPDGSGRARLLNWVGRHVIKMRRGRRIPDSDSKKR